MAFLTFVLVALLQAGPVTPRYEQLENGLRVVVLEDHTLPLVSVQLWYRVGSAQDPPSKPGVCHSVRAILEHRDDAALKLRAAGVRFESHTERDACYFASVLPPNFLEYVLNIEAARMESLTVTPEMVRQGVNAAAGRRESDGMRVLLSEMFPDHPYRHPPELVAESLAELSTEEVNEFLGRWFVPGNATLFVIGDVSTVGALELVRKRFGKLEWAEPPRRAEPERLSAEQVQVSIPNPNRAAITIAWQTPALGYFENAAIDVLMQRLCNPIDGPIHKRLAQTGCQPLRWRRHAWRDSGILVLTVEGSTNVGQAALQQWHTIVEEELTRATVDTPPEISHIRARALARRDVLERRARFGERARGLAEYETLAGDVLMADFVLPRLDHVGVADVQQAASLLKKSRCVCVRSHPTIDAQAPPRRAALPSPLPARDIARTDGVALLQEMSTYATQVPRIERPDRLPPVKINAGPHVTVKSCRLAGVTDTTVFTSKSERNAPRFALLSVEAGFPIEFDWSATREQIFDYMSFHGITLDSHIGRGFSSQAEGDRVMSALEWHARMLRPHGRRSERRSTSGAIEIIVVGDAADDLGRRAAEQFWSDWIPPTQDWLRELSWERWHLRAGSHAMWIPSKNRKNVRVDLRIGLARRGSPADDANDIELAALLLLLGRIPYQECTQIGNAEPEWRSWNIRDGILRAQADASLSDWAGVVARLWSRIQLLRDGAMPQNQIQTALNLARAEQWISLDSGRAITDALWLGREDPWKIHAELTAAQLREFLRARLEVPAVLIQLHSADDLSVPAAELTNKMNNLSE